MRTATGHNRAPDQGAYSGAPRVVPYQDDTLSDITLITTATAPGHASHPLGESGGAKSVVCDLDWTNFPALAVSFKTDHRANFVKGVSICHAIK